ncbi:MAG: Fic family protein [Kiritimatiellia bacterium]
MLCVEGKIAGAILAGKHWRIPSDCPRPVDGRSLRYGGIPKELMGLVLKVDSLKELLSRRRPLTPSEKQRWQESFMVDYTHNSTAIEGNTLTLNETALVLAGVTIGQKPLKDHLEAIGHRDAFNFLAEVVGRGEAMSERLVKELHALVLADQPQDRGVYRRMPVVITGAAHTPPQPYLVVPQMEGWVRDLNATHLHPLVAAALFHISFEAIHPFIDGNGRTGRLLANFILMRAGYLPISIKYENRVAYYDAFTVYHRDANAVPMIRIFVEAEAARLSVLTEALGGNE